ncbi:hypothetical protein SLEP1_g51134 [Rubroshorea leprosula]|uniref:Uncharacterized protein n=1 Tax=Rubroshorea leprosula TaxID=152421 RepID=A0AAV5M323_9ROSI|nr:hypothetical protein SLEP1_g51134 [Rubroshorea leprosula]
MTVSEHSSLSAASSSLSLERLHNYKSFSHWYDLKYLRFFLMNLLALTRFRFFCVITKNHLCFFNSSFHGVHLIQFRFTFPTRSLSKTPRL